MTKINLRKDNFEKIQNKKIKIPARIFEVKLRKD